jgi:uncharacterized protein with HEPN domain
MSFEPRDYLRRILAEADYLSSQIAGTTPERFMRDETLRRAESGDHRRGSEESARCFRAQYPMLEGRAMAGMRDRLIHDYFGVDYELVWEVARNQIGAIVERSDHSKTRILSSSADQPYWKCAVSIVAVNQTRYPYQPCSVFGRFGSRFTASVISSEPVFISPAFTYDIPR